MRKCLLVLALLLPTIFALGQNCTLSVDINSPGTVICSGSSIVLTASASSGTAPYTYSWSTGETTSFISVNKPGTYTVTVSDATPGCAPVKKSITITSAANPDAPTAANIAVCQGTGGTLTATAPGGTYQWYDAPTGGNFLGSGTTFNTPAIDQTTVFYVETTVAGCTSTRKAVTVFVYGSPSGVSGTSCSGNTVTLRATGYQDYIWFDSLTGGTQVGTGPTFITPALTTTTNYYVAGVINGCVTSRSGVTAFITPAPTAPTAQGVTICSGTSANLQASAPAGVIDWFDVPTGGTSLITSPDFTTPVLTVTKTYYVQATTGCESPRTAVTVTVTQTPVAPTASPVSICPGTSAHLVASTAIGNIEWFSRPAGGTVLATGNTFDTPPLNIPTTYYIQANNSGCISPRTAVVVTTNTQPAPPAVFGALICNGSTATLNATGSSGTYQWYDAATGGNLLASSASFTTPALTATRTYYVQALSAEGCASTRTAADVTVLPAITPPSAPGTTICSGYSATLTASGGSSYQWFDAPVGGNKLGEGNVFVTPILTASTNYFVQAVSANGCVSQRSAVAVVVNAIPAAPTGTGAMVCPGSPATISANPPSGTIAWYDEAVGGNLLGTGNSYTTPPITRATTFYAETQSNGCVSTRTAVTVTLITGITPQFQYPYSTVCTVSPNIAPVINNPAGGTFSASPAGLSFVSTTTGEINISASLPGTYVISFANNGQCAGISTARFTIGINNNAAFSYNGPFCQSDANPSAIFPGQYSAGRFTASPAGLVFANASTGEIDLKNSAPGTYTITNTINGGGVCPPSTAQNTVTIYGRAIVNAGPDQSLSNGATVQLNGSITGAVSTGTWSGGTGTFSSTTDLNPTYTAGPGETLVTLRLTSADPAGTCGPAVDAVNIRFGAIPPTPTAQNVTICPGNSATLTATAPGGIYRWYDAATGGNLLSTGDTYTTPVLTATTIFYVATEINGATSARRAVTVTVSALPATPVVNSPTICMGTKAVLTVSNAGTGTYRWYSAAVGGNLLAIGSTYTTPELNADISFYVEVSGGSCTSPRTQANVKVNPYAQVISDASANVCAGAAQNYTILSDVPTATFSWSRAAVAGISNAAVSNQTSATITESLNNTGNAPIDVIYKITPYAGTCPGAVFDYVVTVYPNVRVTSPATLNICNGSPSNYAITFDKPVDGFNWSRAAVAGISNPAVTGQGAAIIRETLTNTTNAPVAVAYIFNYTIGGCSGTFTLTVNVNPGVSITSANKASACNNVALPYTIQSNVPSATFIWSRPAVGTNAAIGGQTSNVINERLVNNTNNPITAVYTIQPIAFGCSGAAFTYTVTVYPTPPTPQVTSNSPVCINSTISLYSPVQIAGAIYRWSGPGGWTSTLQNPTLPASAAAAGRYTLALEINGCTGPSASVDVTIDPLPTANAGTDKLVCPTVTSIPLAGRIGGGATTGIWTSSGGGTFSPSANALNASYIPTAADKAEGSVVLTLTSTSNDDCAAAASNITITFGLSPAVDAGGDQDICTQAGGIPLNARILAGTRGSWSGGSGTFSPSANAVNAVYIPTAADVKAGEVKLKFTVADAGACYEPADEVTIELIPPPTVDAGGTRYVLKGRKITLTPTLSDEKVTYQWSPNIGISSTTVKNPVITGDVDRTYTLTITDSRGCTSKADVKVKVSPELKLNNTFTPNGDGINDTWTITGLVAYEDATVDIFNRAGQRLFHSIGYPVPWNGTFNGQQVPAGVYYYVIDTKVSGVLSGWVTVIR